MTSNRLTSLQARNNHTERRQIGHTGGTTPTYPTYLLVRHVLHILATKVKHAWLIQTCAISLHVASICLQCLKNTNCTRKMENHTMWVIIYSSVAEWDANFLTSKERAWSVALPNKYNFRERKSNECGFCISRNKPAAYNNSLKYRLAEQKKTYTAIVLCCNEFLHKAK